MYFDTLTLAAVVAELRATVLGGRIQRVRMPNQLGIALEIYANGRRRNLIMSAHPQYARIHLSSSRPSRGIETDPPLLLLLRKYVVGGRILAIDQPELERVAVLSIAKGPAARNTAGEDDAPAEPDEDDDADLLPDESLRCDLIVEVMERRSNIVLVNDDNVIMESVRHVTPLMSRRPVQPREPYEMPPRQDKRDPRHATAAGIALLAADTPGKDLAQALVSTYRGLSPQAAREVAFRAAGRTAVALADDLPWEPIAAALRELWSAAPAPCLALDGGKPVAFAPYLLAQFATIAPQPDISSALEQYYAAREPVTAHRQRRDALAAQLADGYERFAHQRRQLEGEMEQARKLEHLRWEGEMIFAFLHEITPGQATLEIEGQTITLGPNRTPVEHAKDRFRAYDKAKSALAHVPERLAEVAARLAGLEQIMALLEIADNYDQIEEIGREAVEHGYLRAQPGRKAKGRRLPPLRRESSDGFTILIGRSAGQNEQVTFKLSSPDDLWLHARNVPGAHVVIKSGGRDVPPRTVQEAAALAAYFSKGRAEAAQDVEVARRRLVRRVPGGPPGLVTYRAEQTVRVAPAAEIT